MIEALRLRNEDAERRDHVLGVGAVPLRKWQHAEYLVTKLIEAHAQADSRHPA